MIRKTVLDNGIRVITEPVAAHSVTLGVWVESGSRHEAGSLNGIAHFYEHMLFKGTPSRSALEIAKTIDSVGGVLNAFTNREFTCFYAKVLAGHLDLAVGLMGDIIRNSLLDLDEVEKERRVILQEIHMVDDTPDDQVHDLFCQAFWKNHPLGRPVLGTEETVRSISRERLLEYQAEHFCGEKLVVCAAGDLDHDRLVALVEETFRGLSRCRKPFVESLPQCSRSVDILERDLEQVHLCLGVRALAQNHPNRFELFLLSAILGGSMSSRLFQEVREERGLAYSIYSYLHCHSDTGALVVYSGTSPEEAPEVVEIILQALRRFQLAPVGEEELRSAKEQLKGNLLLSLESTDNCMTRLAKNEIYLGRQLSVQEVLASIDRVNGEGIQRLAEFLIRDQYLNLQMIGKVDQGRFSNDLLLPEALPAAAGLRG